MMFSKKITPEKKYYTLRGHRFTFYPDKKTLFNTVVFYYMVFKALDGDELARLCVALIMKSEGVSVLRDMDDKQVYPAGGEA